MSDARPPASRPGASAYLSYVANLVRPAPRLLGFVVTEGRRARGVQDSAAVPAVRLTPGLVAQAALDELMVAFMKTPGRVPTIEGIERLAVDIAAAHDLYARRGWLDDPVSFHRAPPSLQDPAIVRSRWPVWGFEHLAFDSGYEPDAEDPARARWLAWEQNRTAHAWVLRHHDPTRPWMVALHAFGMGYPQVDLRAFRANWLHRELGMNVIMPVAPLHGPRRVGRLSGAQFMTPNLVDIVHGFGQAVWDVRRIISWVRAQGGTRIGVYGVSMGAHIAALLAAVEEDLDCVVSAFPTTDFVELFFEHGPRHGRKRAQQNRLLNETALAVHRLVTPLTMPVRVPSERLFICGGLADRMATPAQAHRLWEHWDRPRIEWFNSNHIAFLWSGRVTGFVREALHATGVV